MWKNKVQSTIKLKDGFVGLLFFFISLYLIKIFQFTRPLDAAVFSIVMTAIPMIVMTFASSQVHLQPDYGFQFSHKNKVDPVIVFKKTFALFFIWVLIISSYLLIPEYQKEMYLPFGRLLYRLIPILIISAFPYFYLCERYQKSTNSPDSYLHLAQILLFKEKIQWRLLSQLALGWIVKAFFFPLMFVALVSKMDFYILNEMILHSEPRLIYQFFYELFFAIDIIFVTIGYALTFKIFHSHIRSTESTFIGWFFAIICYMPFWPMLDKWYFHYYMEAPPWWIWLKDSSWQIPWMLMIVFSLGIYTFATVSFGIRFSNLTNRGIITHGPYRWLKHPAYVSKCFAWLLISVPFTYYPQYSSPWVRTSALVVLWGIYFVRAKTEEHHLKSDPHYVQYLESFKK